MARKLPKQHYVDAVKLLRHGYYDADRERYSGKFADGFEARDGFDLRDVDSWTTQQKATVTRLYNELDKLMARPFTVVRSRKPENLKRVQKAAQHQRHPKELKVALVPVARPGEDPEIKLRRSKAKPKGRVTVKERGVVREPVAFDDAGLAFDDLEANTAAAVRAFTEQYPGKLYVPLAGEYEVKGQAVDAAGLTAQIRKLMNKYGEDKGHDPDDLNSHHFSNWLFGVAVYNFKTVTEFNAFRTERTAAADALQKQRRRDRYAFRRDYGPRGRKRRD